MSQATCDIEKEFQTTWILHVTFDFTGVYTWYAKSQLLENLKVHCVVFGKKFK